MFHFVSISVYGLNVARPRVGGSAHDVSQTRCPFFNPKTQSRTYRSHQEHRWDQAGSVSAHTFSDSLRVVLS